VGGQEGFAAAAIQWEDGPNATVSTADIVRQLEEASKQPGVVARNEGDAEEALAAAAQRIDVIYQAPFLAHAAMEPMNCTAHVRKDGCDLWVGTQAPTLTQAVVAQATGLPREAVKIHNRLLGGGFGRRLEPDGSLLAVKIAQQVDGPVKVVWSREEDIQHDMYRPYYYDRCRAVSTRAAGWWPGSTALPVPRSSHAMSRLSTRTVSILMRSKELPSRPMLCRTSMSTMSGSSRRASRPPSGVVSARPQCLCRRELHRRAGGSCEAGSRGLPQGIAGHNPRALGVLNLATEKAGWGGPLPAGRGRGVSLQFAFGTYLSQVAEVEVSSDGSFKVHRIVCAVDCGLAVNPDTIAPRWRADRSSA